MNAAAAPAVSIEAFEAGSIDANAFDHESHIYAAWLYLERWPLHEAIEKFSAALRRLTIKVGADGKYHETITWFFMILISERRAAAKQSSWFAFRRDNNDLVRDAGKTLQRYYSKELLESNHARQQFLLPDKVATSDA